jgi:hypothetical protein
MTPASPVVMSYVTVWTIRTMSDGPGSLEGLQVPGLDQDPLATLVIVGLAEKSGIES